MSVFGFSYQLLFIIFWHPFWYQLLGDDQLHDGRQTLDPKCIAVGPLEKSWWGEFESWSPFKQTQFKSLDCWDYPKPKVVALAGSILSSHPWCAIPGQPQAEMAWINQSLPFNPNCCTIGIGLRWLDRWPNLLPKDHMKIAVGIHQPHFSMLGS